MGVGAASCSVRRNDSSGTRLGRIWPFRDDATSVGDRSAFFASNAGAATWCDARSKPAPGDLASDNCASGFDVVARFSRRRTSTVNEGTACLKVFLDTACHSADSSRPRDLAQGNLARESATKAIGVSGGNERVPAPPRFIGQSTWMSRIGFKPKRLGMRSCPGTIRVVGSPLVLRRLRRPGRGPDQSEALTRTGSRRKMGRSRLKGCVEPTC